MSYQILRADARRVPIADRSAHCVVTSPPYFALRDYGVPGQVGNEATPREYVAAQVAIFREVFRVLRDDGTLFLNVGDSFSGGKGRAGGVDGRNPARRPGARPTDVAIPGLKRKELIGIPWRLALALQDDGWYLRQEIIWRSPNKMPESVRDRPLRVHEQVFLLTKKPRYFYDTYAVRTPQKTLGKRHEGKSGYRAGHPSKGGVKARSLNPLGAACPSVWDISSGAGYKGGHFATMPVELARRCIRLGTSERGCCPRCGAQYRRLVARTRVPTRPGERTKVQKGTAGYEIRANVIGNRDTRRHATEARLLGWEPGCGCDAGPPIPSLVFDPYGGVMTTLVAAGELGRDGIATELGEGYARAGARRLARPHARPEAVAAPTPEIMPLFPEEAKP